MASFKVLAVPAVLVALLVSSLASAEPPFPLPEEGFLACADKKEGEACTAQFRGMEIHGACAAVPDRGLFCRPAGPPPRSRERRRPQRKQTDTFEQLIRNALGSRSSTEEGVRNVNPDFVRSI